jgi:2-oxoglutarate dehydrogenase E1 component
MTRYGHNLGFIDELYRQYRSNPESVSVAWREFFRDYTPDDLPQPAAQKAPPAMSTTAELPPYATPMVGVDSRIVANMESSLEIPTATSARTLPVKILEENRRIINQHQATVAGAKISFTHLIAWSIVRCIERHPGINARFLESDGKPHRVVEPEVRLGLAIDLEKKGRRVLLVPNVKQAQTLDFPAFVASYDDLVERAREDRLTVDDHTGTTLTITNPGTIGTSLSVPRLMQGQGAIIGVGAIGYPAEYAGMAPQVISQLGLSRVMTLTCTYDHRIIQGAVSGRFLADLEAMLLDGPGFYARVFSELGIPREAFVWSGDRNPQHTAGGSTDEAIAKQAGVLQLIRAFRVGGHLWADLDPLVYEPQPNPDLELATYGLSVWDLDREFICGGLGGNSGKLELRSILDTLQRTYCRHTGIEYMHIQDSEARHWLQERLEHADAAKPLERELKIRILKDLNRSEAFETFLHRNYVGQKRFSLEGAETLIPMLDLLFEDAAMGGVERVVMGMAHRGRLNVLAHVVGKTYGQIFREFEELDPLSTHGSGDVKYHLGACGEYHAADGTVLQVELASNPSHLEAVNPVVEGMVRAVQDFAGDERRARTLPLLIHGDAAFAGQGVVAETLHLSKLSGYRTGGTVHLVVNNQIGFTTGPSDARSSTYPTDVAKMIGAPIFHVNGDRPEDAVRAVRLALAYRREFQSDVVVDLFCYRRWGHNEADDPSYTHPLLYAKIRGHRSVRKLYTERLLRGGDFDQQTAEQALEHFHEGIRKVHDEVKQAVKGAVSDLAPADDGSGLTPDAAAATQLDETTLLRIVDGLGRVPAGFTEHPKLAEQLARRRPKFENDEIDWALGEALAFGGLVLEGVPIRLSGEDSGRGTFSQRHATLYDHSTAEVYVPLAHLEAGQAPFQVYDSLLSEFAVLGFDYGYSVEHPEALVLWEAQFGDFSNGAQVIIDQFLISAEEKWGQRSGLVMLLPHGHEGQGPEHSSARLERFLQLASRKNIRIANPTTPAQYFHLLRLQARHPERKPLVVMTPKSLLRHPRAVSPRRDFSAASFESLLDDPHAPAANSVRRVVLCSGKLYYDLAEAVAADDAVAIVRLELLYPFDSPVVSRVLGRYQGAAHVVWAQEEPLNMGAWDYLNQRLRALLAPGQTLSCVARPRAGSPATGSARRHAKEQGDLVERALAGSVDEHAGVRQAP